MDFINQARNLADTLKDKAQEAATNTAKGIEEVVDGIKNTAVEITTSSINAINDLPATAQQGFQALQNVGKALEGTAIGVTTSSVAIAEALQNLPKTAAELALEMPKIAYRLRYRAGLRTGDLPRSDTDVMKLFEKIPGTSKLGGNERTIREFLSDKHGSHIIPRSQGGSNGADNILWEVGVDNLRRGAEVMTVGEQFYIRVYK
ncbi:hypothetical protein LC613_38725 [Nostoc sphaeroides CHAB 2801]|uniref:hypothetical protein n=1 Tax=Nostoc sphaeroides TaxID=446679 RepID=UPI001E3B2ACC|nr:hypothetical protein [Nostoc sphaeroides]MCC5633406.1 hypothetical protein [Nostoc sphaeroides CHAB 2801]